MIVVCTWCRVCGREAKVELPPGYEPAVDVAYWLDDQDIDHDIHSERGGWGVHWRLDEALQLAFPHEHEIELFPTPIWYPHVRDTDLLALPRLRLIRDPRFGINR
jgi:hypothetical protein